MQDLFWLLIPAAAAAGWYAASRSRLRASSRSDSMLGSEYLKGLNYLLNEQQDKAIDIFIRMLEVNSDTVETHLALGNLFRKRGEVDRAIRIHQNLISRPTLDNEQRFDAVLELGQDYMKAGLFDRAEGLFQELIQENVHVSSVLPWLLDIYQQERDWENAIDIADQMGFVGGQPARSVIAQFYCELVEDACARGDTDTAGGLLDKALEYNPHCARAGLIRGNIASGKGDYVQALAAYRQVVERDIDLLPEVLDAMHNCHVELGSVDEMIDYLHTVISRHAGISPVLALADILAEVKGSESAADFIAGKLGKRPSVRGLSRFIEFSLDRSEGAAHANLLILKNMTEKLLENKPVYTCRDCGFSGKVLHWQCPGCKHWNTVKPIQGVEGG